MDRMVAAEDDIDYSPFYKAVKEGDIQNIWRFIECHPQALTITFHDNDDLQMHGGTALHHVLRKFDELKRGEMIAALLVDRMTPDHLEIKDNYHNNPLVAAIKTGSCPLHVLKLMVNKNPKLANIGIPVYLASEYKLEDMTRFLYTVTDKTTLLSMDKSEITQFLKNLVLMNLFGIASDFVQALPSNLQDCSYRTLPTLARMISRTEFQHLRSEALAFLQLVCSVQSSAYDWFYDDTCRIIVEDAETGSMEFVKQLFQIRPDILENSQCRAKLLSVAVEKRETNIFNLIYPHIQPKDLLIKSHDEYSETGYPIENNILHLAAKLAPSYVLTRKSGAVLQMQSELQWFREVWNLASPECREARNRDRFTPRELLIEKHKLLKEAGEKSMKEIAQSCTVVGALIVTIMFAAAFTVPGGNDQNTGLPVFLKTVMFKVFIICDAISLYSSTTSVLTCLGILTSRYAEEDFLVKLPTKLMISLSTLFFSITAMMVAFCAALAMMVDGSLQLILPVVLVALVPVIIFLWSTVSLLYDTYMSTYRPNIVYNSTKLIMQAKHQTPMIKQSTSVIRRLFIKKRDEIVLTVRQ